VIKWLLVVFVVQVRLSLQLLYEKNLPKVSVGFHQNEQITLMYVNQHLTEGKLLNANLDSSLWILSLCKLIQGSVLLLYSKLTFKLNLPNYPQIL
jgi:hypothetical protein